MNYPCCSCQLQTDWEVMSAAFGDVMCHTCAVACHYIPVKIPTVFSVPRWTGISGFGTSKMDQARRLWMQTYAQTNPTVPGGPSPWIGYTFGLSNTMQAPTPNTPVAAPRLPPEAYESIGIPKPDGRLAMSRRECEVFLFALGGHTKRLREYRSDPLLVPVYDKLDQALEDLEKLELKVERHLRSS